MHGAGVLRAGERRLGRGSGRLVQELSGIGLERVQAVLAAEVIGFSGVGVRSRRRTGIDRHPADGIGGRLRKRRGRLRRGAGVLFRIGSEALETALAAEVVGRPAMLE
jgi:hypothetical protein